MDRHDLDFIPRALGVSVVGILLNKANSGGDSSGKGPPVGPIVRTKPICRHGPRWTRARKVTGGAIARAHYAKQTQFRGSCFLGLALSGAIPRRTNKANPGRAEGVLRP
jgi:hypothetical protein